MHISDQTAELKVIQDGLRVGLEELMARRDYARVEDILRSLDRRLEPLITAAREGRSAPLG